MRATWKGAVIADSDDVEMVEGNAYFPANAVNHALLRESAKHTVCSWKGDCSYYDVVVDGKVNGDAAWVYRDPKDAAKHIKGRIAFWRGVRVER
jgi:uncharacterized protein (DUF427 family)